MKKSKEIDWTTIGIALFFGAIIGGVILFVVLYYKQERGISDKLNECSFYTVAIPAEMKTSHFLYYNFYYKGIKYRDEESVGAGDVGSYTMGSVLSKRYWVKVYCKDLYVNRIIWKHPVPDTLQYVPPAGWKDIPYGLWHKFNED